MHATPLLLLVGLTLSATGCVQWRTDDVAPQQLLANHKPESMRVTLKDSSTITIGNPRLGGDTLIGARGRAQVRIPLDSVARTETPHVKTGGTVGLVLGLAALVALGYAIAFAISMSNSN